MLPPPASESFEAYCFALRRWLSGAVADDEALQQAGLDLCLSVREPRMSPEQMLIELHARGIPCADGVRRSRTMQDKRYVHAIALLLETYFGNSACGTPSSR